MPCTDSCKAIGPAVIGQYVLRTEGYKAIGPVVIGRYVHRRDLQGHCTLGRQLAVYCLDVAVITVSSLVCLTSIAVVAYGRDRNIVT